GGTRTASPSTGPAPPSSRSGCGSGTSRPARPASNRLAAAVTKFGPYELLQKLGSGATAEVHLATGPNRAGATLFALKVLLPHLSERKELRDQLLREAKLASLIHHPNVAEVFDVGEAEERAYLAMEYVRGRPLSALLRRLREAGGEERLTVEESCFIVREAALGLHEAHEVLDARRRPLGLV